MGALGMNITASYLDALKPDLTDRDLAIIREVGRFKLMTGGQLERLLFAEYTDPASGKTVEYSSVSRARNRQAVLRRLTEHRVLARVGERRVGGGKRGSASFLYTLDVAGQHLARWTSSRPRRPFVWYEPTIKHYLAIAELYVRLVEAQRRRQLTLLKFDTEPYCWRTFGQRTLKPDAFVQIGIDRDGQRRKGSFFVEVDRAGQHGAKIATKLPQYLSYRHHEQGSGQVFPGVVFLAPSPTRAAYLAALIQRRPEAAHLFRVALYDEAVAALSGA
jgi:hypothetical protein